MRAPFTCVVALLLTVVGLGANAQPYTINYTFDYSAPTLDIHYGGSTEDCYAGPFGAFFNSGGPGGWSQDANNPFSVYCVDITHNISPPTSEQVTLASIGPTFNTSTSNPAVTVAELQESAYLIDSITVDPTNLNQLAALQVAIWGVVGGDTITTNNALDNAANSFYISSDGNGNYSSILTDANADLNFLGTKLAAGGGGGNGTLFEISPQTSNRDANSGQNMLAGGSLQVPGGFGPSTPEGSTIAMLAFGLAPFGFGWFKRRRATS